MTNTKSLRKPTLKQLFNAWLKHQKKSNEVWKERYKLEEMAKNIGVSTELITDNENIYRITVTNHYSNPYKVEKIAEVNELNTQNLKLGNHEA